LKKLIGSLNFLIWLVIWFRMLEWGLDNHFKETTFLLPIMVLVPLIGAMVSNWILARILRRSSTTAKGRS